MTELQIVWFLLIGFLLTGYAVLDGFDLGVGFWHLFAKKEEQRQLHLRAIGPVWDGNEVWLLTGAGAIFAAFPPVYATVFSGLYLALVLVLLALIFRAVSLEVRSQVDSPGWRRGWDVAFAVGSTVPALLFGVALGNVVIGIELDASGNYVGGFWALLNPYALLSGVTGLVMLASHGARFIALKSDGEIRERARRWARVTGGGFCLLVFANAVWLALSGGNLLGFAAATLACGATVMGGVWAKKQADGKAFVASSLTIGLVMVAVGVTLFPNMVVASNDPALSLTIYNSSSSQNTLTAMLVMALIGMPLVIGYTIFIYRTFRGKVVTGHY